MKFMQIGQKRVPTIGQGTWRMGMDSSQRDKEIMALRYGIDQGLTLIDTAEMYADGESERIVGEAIRPYAADDIFVVSKVWPNHASYEGTLAALDASRQRLQRDTIDLYLLHWPSQEHPLAPTLNALEHALQKGWIGAIGVSNFPTELLDEARNQMTQPLVANQVEYSLTARAVEHTLLPYAHNNHIAIMAYSPVKHLHEIDESRRQTLAAIAENHQATPYMVALSWVIRHSNVCAIPKAVSFEHIDQNRKSADLILSREELLALDQAFPQGSRDMELRYL